MGGSQNRTSGSVWQEDTIAASNDVNPYWFPIDSKYVTTEVEVEQGIAPQFTSPEDSMQESWDQLQEAPDQLQEAPDQSQEPPEDFYIASDNSGAEESEPEEVITVTEQEIPDGEQFNCEDAEDEEAVLPESAAQSMDARGCEAVATEDEAEETRIKVITAVVEEVTEPEEKNWLDAEYESFVIIPDEEDLDAETAPVFVAEEVLNGKDAAGGLDIPQDVPEEVPEKISAAEPETDENQEKAFMSFDRYLKIVDQGKKMLSDYLLSGSALASLSADVRSKLCEIITNRYTECVFSGDPSYFERVRDLVESEGNDDTKNMTLHDMTSELLGSIDIKEEYKKRYGNF